MTVSGTTAVAEEAGSTAEWLETSLPWPARAGRRDPARAFVCLSGAGRGREPVDPVWPARGGAGNSGASVLRMDGPTGAAQVAATSLPGCRVEGLGQARVARARGIPVVLSPICWYEPRAMAALEPEPMRKVASLAGWGLRSVLPGTPSWRLKLLKMADAVPAGLRCEANQLMRLFGVSAERIHVVPNGVLPAFCRAQPDEFHHRFGAFPFVLSVGRIEPRKNTLGLIEAARRLELPLVVAGEAPAGFDRYEAVCRRAAGDRTIWLGRVAHDDPLLASAYAAARVFASPSWFGDVPDWSRFGRRRRWRPVRW